MARRKGYAETVTLTEHLRSISSKGGKARAAAMSEEERTANAEKAGKAGGAARAAKLPAAERKKIAAKAAKARWAKKRPRKARGPAAGKS
jgi:hypothetical protein